MAGKRKTKNAPRKSASIPQADRLTKLQIMMWAALTMTSFLVAFLISEALGASFILPFVFGGTAMFAVMLTEAFLRGRIWIFEPGFRESLGHPEIAYRILIFSGIFLLVLESAFLLGSLNAGF